MKLGLLFSTVAYNSFAASLLGFVGQLCTPPDAVRQAHERALRKLFPGPGNWIMPHDMENLTAYGFKVAFRCPTRTALAAKIRIVQTCMPNLQKMQLDLRSAQQEHFRRPHGKWHYTSIVQVLHEAWEHVRPRRVSGENAKTRRPVPMVVNATVIKELPAQAEGLGR